MEEQKREVIKHFDAWSASYEDEIWNRDKYFHHGIRNLVLNLLFKYKKQKILELGLGPGIYFNKFIERNHYVIGVDISWDMLKQAKVKMRKNHFNLFNFVLADAEFLPFRKDSFDTINCIEVLRHLPRPYKTIWNVFREMERTITKKGFVLITLPNILFPLNLFSVVYYTIPRTFLRLFKKKIGFHQGANVSFPHFPVLYNEPEDHMFNLLFIKKLTNKTKLKITHLKGIFFFPACPKMLFPIFNKINQVLSTTRLAFLAYSFLIMLRRA